MSLASNDDGWWFFRSYRIDFYSNERCVNKYRHANVVQLSSIIDIEVMLMNYTIAFIDTGVCAMNLSSIAAYTLFYRYFNRYIGQLLRRLATAHWKYLYNCLASPYVLLLILRYSISCSSLFLILFQPMVVVYVHICVNAHRTLVVDFRPHIYCKPNVCCACWITKHIIIIVTWWREIEMCSGASQVLIFWCRMCDIYFHHYFINFFLSLSLSHSHSISTMHSISIHLHVSLYLRLDEEFFFLLLDIDGAAICICVHIVSLCWAHI